MTATRIADQQRDQRGRRGPSASGRRAGRTASPAGSREQRAREQRVPDRIEHLLVHRAALDLLAVGYPRYDAHLLPWPTPPRGILSGGPMHARRSALGWLYGATDLAKRPRRYPRGRRPPATTARSAGAAISALAALAVAPGLDSGPRFVHRASTTPSFRRRAGRSSSCSSASGTRSTFPLEQTCCGQMHLNTGYARGAAAGAPLRAGLRATRRRSSRRRRRASAWCASSSLTGRARRAARGGRGAPRVSSSPSSWSTGSAWTTSARPSRTA